MGLAPGTYCARGRDPQLVFLNFALLVELPNSQSTENVEKEDASCLYLPLCPVERSCCWVGLYSIEVLPRGFGLG